MITQELWRMEKDKGGNIVNLNGPESVLATDSQTL
jgi:hypothetical protein